MKNTKVTSESKKISDKELIEIAYKAKDNAYAPYSKCYIGAALLCKDGTVYSGCNVESAAYGLSNCAERTAIFKAISEGKKDFEKIVVAGDDYFFPCGACRQVMGEFCDGDFEIIIANKTEENIKVRTLDQLLPERFELAK